MERAERLMSNAENMDSVVIMNGREPFLDSTFWYLTGSSSGTFEGSMAVVSKDGSLDVITGKLEETCARGGKGNVHVYETRDERNEILKGLLKGSGKIGMNIHAVTHGSAEFVKSISGADIVDASKAILETVSIKDPKEIEAIRKACIIASKTAEAIPDFLTADMSEKDMSVWIDSEMRKLGAEGAAFETIAAFGEFSAEPHHRPSDRKPRLGDTALFDFGCRYGMYCSDLTRTVFFEEPDDIMKRAYRTVAKAKEAGMERIRDGASAKDVDKAARDIIDASEFKGSFIHSFGHGVGMDVHEGISVSHLSEDVLKENMVITAEPGIYIPGVGGVRIEDTVLVRKDGCEPLTRFDQRLTVI